jgi:hypothetical protein
VGIQEHELQVLQGIAGAALFSELQVLSFFFFLVGGHTGA